MVICDYVRADDGILHMIAAGIDKIHTAEVPAGRNIGVAVRLLLTRAECDRPHDVLLIFQTEDGVRLVEVTATFQVAYPEGLPPGWPAQALLPLNLGLPLPSYGVYSLELLVDGNHKKDIHVLVARPEQ
jgi:hypothetical protein